MTNLKKTMTTIGQRFNTLTSTIPMWNNRDSYTRPYIAPTALYRPPIPQCDYCHKRGHTRQTCHRLIGYPPHYQCRNTGREQWEQTGFRPRPMGMEHRFDRLPQKPATESEVQPPQMAAKTHHPNNTDKQTTT